MFLCLFVFSRIEYWTLPQIPFKHLLNDLLIWSTVLNFIVGHLKKKVYSGNNFKCTETEQPRKTKEDPCNHYPDSFIVTIYSIFFIIRTSFPSIFFTHSHMHICIYIHMCICIHKHIHTYTSIYIFWHRFVLDG